MITREQALAAKEKFSNEYLKPPLHGVGITRDNNQEFALYVTMEQSVEGLPKEIDGVSIIYATIEDDRFHKSYCGN